ncbi:ABC transporter permease [Microbacterium hibisci]|uniref:ABC transporter permease n=1 Tax=Microbacterium hibisci TaxID=2036000 RepID=UPI001941EF26|nr:ABC transporter permease [Microbacterium hibisci]
MRDRATRATGATGAVGPALAVPAWAWLLVFFVAPVAMVVWFSFGYKPGVFGTHANDILSFDRYLEALSPTFFATFANTLWVGVIGTVLCFGIGAPVAYWMAFKVRPQRRGILIALVLVPFWTNFLVRTIGWQVILAPEGWLSTVLQGIGVLDGPLELLYTRAAVIVGVVYNYLPLMILPLFVAFDRVGPALREASKDLGAGKLMTFVRVTLPLSLPGIVAGVLLVYIPLMGDYITATVLGGAKGNMIGQLVAGQFQTAQNWALGSAMAVLLMLVIALSIGVFAAVIWLVALPFRSRNRLVIRSGPETAKTDAAPAASLEVTT